MIKLGSLFDGIGAFPLAASRYGITPVWASEIEKFPISVTSKHFPDMKHLGDIREIDGSEIEPVDIITFGSPCQDMSVAGKREGLDGERSHLFYEAVRIIHGMLQATHGLYPTFAIWENVPGALSSNGGADFRSVLRSLAEIGAVDIAWRILDAQYFGVPQRRRRIFLIADFRGERAGEILFEPESLSGDIEESRKAREEVAGSVGEGIKRTSKCLTPWDVQSKRIYERDGKWPALYSGDGGGGAHGYVAQSEPILFEPRSPDGVPRIHGEICPTLNTMQGGQRQPCVAQPIPIHDKATRCSGGGPTRKGDGAGNGLGIGKPGDPFPTMTAGDRHAVAQCLASSAGCRVRRLTPIECERLQGFPDGWTEGSSDTARYKMIGNSIAVPCLEWIFSRLVRLM